MSGQIVHTEIPADDTAQGQGVLGLAVRVGVRARIPARPSTTWRASATRQGVAITNMEPGKHGMRSYFDVDDIDDGIARVKELGGEAGEKMPVPSDGLVLDVHRPARERVRSLAERSRRTESIRLADHLSVRQPWSRPAQAARPGRRRGRHAAQTMTPRGSLQ